MHVYVLLRCVPVFHPGILVLSLGHTNRTSLFVGSILVLVVCFEFFCSALSHVVRLLLGLL